MSKRNRAPKAPNGFILWEGNSLLDGAPIVAIVTGLRGKASRNTKTGHMVQSWILRSDIAPNKAIHTGADKSVCGTCAHRGRVALVAKSKGAARRTRRNVKRSCYVKVWQAPTVVWKAYKRGIYPHVTPDQARALLAGKRFRVGSYGNASACPFEVWESALADTEANTGYVHDWRTCDPRWKRYVMASCDSGADYLEAKKHEWRTFRIRRPDEPAAPRELPCPASKESGFKTTCALCVACGGARAKAKVDIVINAHGSGAGAFKSTR